MIVSLIVMVLVVFGLPVTFGLLAHSDSKAGARFRRALGISDARMRETPSFSRWWTADRDRSESSRQIAGRHHLRYVGDSPEQMDRIDHFFVFSNTWRGAVEELVLGEDEEMREALFTHRQHRWRHTFAHFTSASLDLPVFRLGWPAFPLRDFTAPAIAFDGESYEVRGENEPQIRALFDRNVRAALSAYEGFWIEGKQSQLLCGKAVDLTQLAAREDFFRSARAICAILAKRSAGGAV
jgi:hypothetical protein